MVSMRESRLNYSSLPDELQGGSAERLSLSVESITLANGETVALPSDGVTAVIGANNVGKSTFLRQILQLASRHPGMENHDRHATEVIKLKREGSDADLVAWLDQNSQFTVRGSEGGFISHSNHQPLGPRSLPQLWGCDDRLGNLWSFMIHRSDPFERAGMLAPRQRRGISGDQGDHPFYHLEDDSELMDEFSNISEKYFREPLILDWLSGNMQLRMGRLSLDAPPVNKISKEYRLAVDRLSLVNEQGDGIKSFLGTILPLITSAYPVVLLDEPEAFLHPPQAHALGYELGRLSKMNKTQLILATHDRNILTGLLEADVSVSVIRLDRAGNVVQAHQINADELRFVWADSVLRYSNVLDGLFHRAVVIAEADRDCRFYAAALSEADKTERLPVAPSDVLFVPSGGKAGIAKLAGVLRAAHVPVVATPDLDILNEVEKIRTLVTCMKGSEAWDSIKQLYTQATRGFRQVRTPVTCGDVLVGVTAVIGQKKGDPYSGEIKNAIAAQLRANESPWLDLKRYGQGAFKTHGGAQASADGAKLLSALDAMGITTVRVGELEGFAPSLGVAKDPEWLPAALEDGAHRAMDAQRHVLSFFSSLWPDDKTEP
jgi:ABC-type cobalamin/Fe3+-siderophores transport system ATPase subunit